MERQLDWLSEHPNLSVAIRQARAEPDPVRQFAAARQLAGFRRDFVATERIDRLSVAAWEQLDGAQRAPCGLARKRLALLGSHSLSHLAPGIRVAGLTRGLTIGIHVGLYNSYRQELLAGDRALAEFEPDFCLLALDEMALGLSFPIDMAAAEIETEIDRSVADIRQLWRRMRERYSGQPIQQTLVAGATPPIFGNYDGLVPGTTVAAVDLLNARLRLAARNDKVLLVDLAWEAARRGFIPDLVNPKRWHQAKQLIDPTFAPVCGDLIARVVAAASGLSRKCLVLDLDNTLWGGVVGDDGVAGIRLGHGSAEGEAYAAFQRYAAQLAQRGVILAVCSKNDPEVAQHTFTSHPEMVLKRDDIAVFVANWDDKAGNLRKIARTLDVGLDSLVFVDDNPAEREIVRSELPEVAVPELPDDVAFYPRCLANAGYFETACFTADDVVRGRSYAARGRRLAEIENSTDLDGYLRGLQMEMKAEAVGPTNISRVTQLVNKTNQFNLTTRRFSEVQLEHFVATRGNLALAFRLRDRLDDAGLISVILASPSGADTMRIVSWLMSCRVLGRCVEAAALQALVRAASDMGASALIGDYVPTPRNGIVALHYQTLGFSLIPSRDGDADGMTSWWFDIGAPLPRHHVELDYCFVVPPRQAHIETLKETA